jgi:hypothetical protein
MGYNTAGVWKRNSFQELKKKFLDTQPIRGNSLKVRPLGIRRYHGLASISMPDDDTVHLNYIGRPLVVWHSDGMFEVHHPYYTSAFVPDNIYNFLPKGLGFGWNKSRLTIMVGSEEFVMQRDVVYKFQHVGDKYFFLNSPVAYNYRLNMSEFKNKFAPVQHFLDWFNIVSAVNNEHSDLAIQEVYANFKVAHDIPPLLFYDMVRDKCKVSRSDERVSAINMLCWEEQRLSDYLPVSGLRRYHNRYIGFHRPSSETLYKWITDRSGEHWTEALYVILNSQGTRIRSGNKFTIQPDKLREYVANIVKFLYRDELFNKVRLDKGVVASKTNYNFFAPEAVFTINSGTIDMVSKILGESK